MTFPPDGQRVVVASHGRNGKPSLWLAPLDRRSAPRQVPNGDGEQPLFGAGGEVFFRKVEGTSGFLYGIREEGTGLRKVIETKVQEVSGSMSADRQWLVVISPVLEESGVALAVPVGGGTPVRLPIARYGWSWDGKHLFMGDLVRTLVIPLAPGQVLPRNSAGAVPSTEPEFARLPGVREIPSADVEPGRTADVYAFTKVSAQRNLYRIPVP
jgi:hypothetical protein